MALQLLSRIGAQNGAMHSRLLSGSLPTGEAYKAVNILEPSSLMLHTTQAGQLADSGVYRRRGGASPPLDQNI